MKSIKTEGKRVRVSTINNQQSRTHQEFKDSCDVNNIIARYKKTGVIDHRNPKQPMYGDFSSIPDYQSALQTVLNANEAFASLSSEIRLRFHNDPALLLEFIQEPKNHAEGVKLGLFNSPKTEPSTLATSPAPTQNDLNDPPPSAGGKPSSKGSPKP